EILALPLGAAGAAVQDVFDAVLVDGQLKGGGALRAERSAADGAFGIALDVDDLVVAHTDDLAAAHRTVRADARHFAGVGDLQAGDFLLGGPQVHPQAEQSPQGKPSPRGSAKEISSTQSAAVVQHSDLCQDPAGKE